MRTGVVTRQPHVTSTHSKFDKTLKTHLKPLKSKLSDLVEIRLLDQNWDKEFESRSLKGSKFVKTLKTHLKPLKSKCSDFAKNWHLGYFEDGKFNYEIHFERSKSKIAKSGKKWLKMAKNG